MYTTQEQYGSEKYVSTKPRSLTVGGLNNKPAIQTRPSQMCFFIFEGELILPDASYEQKIPIFLLIQAAPSGRVTPVLRFLLGWGKGPRASNACEPGTFSHECAMENN